MNRCIIGGEPQRCSQQDFGLMVPLAPGVFSGLHQRFRDWSSRNVDSHRFQLGEGIYQIFVGARHGKLLDLSCGRSSSETAFTNETNQASAGYSGSQPSHQLSGIHRIGRGIGASDH
jgi:hypothetical protein